MRVQGQDFIGGVESCIVAFEEFVSNLDSTFSIFLYVDINLTTIKKGQEGVLY